MATGTSALQDNTTGNNNTASGFQALMNNTTAANNTATGYNALATNTTGGYDTAAGANALLKNTTGQGNIAVGANAMYGNTSGSNNIAVGYGAGSNLTTGSNNLDIGNPGVAAESNTIRIGIQGRQHATYIAGIFPALVTGDAVVVSNTGRLGVVKSSARYKRDIHNMDAVSNNLLKLRPVTFRYKDDSTGTRQYGLIAEEVARLYPELVTVGADGQVETVHYHEFIPMLLNELQKQAGVLEKQNTQLQDQTMINRRQAEQIRKLTAQMAAIKASTGRELMVVQERLATMEQAMQAQDGNRKLTAAYR
jgi:hypothetical protein